MSGDAQRRLHVHMHIRRPITGGFELLLSYHDRGGRGKFYTKAKTTRIVQLIPTAISICNALNPPVLPGPNP